MVEGDVGDESHADAVGISSREERGSRRRAHRGDVEPRVAEALGGEAIDIRRRDGRPEAAEVTEPGVVKDDGEDVRHSLGLRAGGPGSWPLGEPARVLGGVAHDGLSGGRLA